jgi:acyl phosphate:glycerol-3-phosphate acyltransferase
MDIREHGSGNLGATNAWRVLGWKAGVGVLVLDAAKGALAVGIASIVHPAAAGPVAYDWFLIAAAMSAVVGHSYSPYVRFAGGKGVATAAGALLVIAPLAWTILLVTFLAVTLILADGEPRLARDRALFPVLMLIFYWDRFPLVWFAFLAAALVIWRHRSNIGRIMRGEESKISLRKARTRRGKGWSGESSRSHRSGIVGYGGGFHPRGQRRSDHALGALAEVVSRNRRDAPQPPLPACRTAGDSACYRRSRGGGTGAEVLVIATPSKAVHDTAEAIRPYYDGRTPVVSLAKGLEPKTLARMTVLLGESPRLPTAWLRFRDRTMPRRSRRDSLGHRHRGER